jgi:hypothetical protein
LLLFKAAERYEILNNNEQKVAGDFPTVLYEIVGKRSSVMDGTLTIQELNDVLDELSMNNKNQFVISFLISPPFCYLYCFSPYDFP